MEETKRKRDKIVIGVISVWKLKLSVSLFGPWMVCFWFGGCMYQYPLPFGVKENIEFQRSGCEIYRKLCGFAYVDQ